MSYKGSSHIGLYLSTLDPNKISEFYDAFWVLISDRLPIKIKEGGRILTCAHRQDPLDGSPALSSRRAS